ncbi:hypothetical protein [Luteimonas sp. FCS-9]|uniref:hypothetical protein n=1 Tax=Luteimonas sp. FCS-9 TaxID=1547516 RepID=UPI00063EA735|nr:hypothetical protein [Luteimonas sp. FCS-9]KLI99289.1 hypothetical protein WQ56_12885 [Luteimonas sp. FCS-9]
MSNPYSFLGGCVQSRDVLRTIAQIDQLTAQGSTWSNLFKRDQAQGRWFSFKLEWTATRICTLVQPELTVLATGPDGIVSASIIAGATEETIDATDNGPSRRGPIRDLRVIDGVPYAVGMGRQVYRREAPDQWTRQDDGVVLPRGVIELCGFNAIDGIGERDLHAVGFNGELWQRTDGTWRRHDSPTPRVLHAVAAVREDLAYASGQLGTLLRYDGDRWRAIEHGTDLDDLWGLAWFRGTLYAACDQGLFRLEGDRLAKVDMGLPHAPTCRHLSVGDGVLLSCGPKHIVWTDDGEAWHDITP